MAMMAMMVVVMMMMMTVMMLRLTMNYILQFVTTLPRTHYLGVDVSKGLTISHMASHPADAQYPDARLRLS